MRKLALVAVVVVGGVSPAAAQFQANTSTAVNNIGNTSDDIARAYDSSTGRSQRRLNDLLSGGGFSRTVNRVVDEGTSAVTGAVDDVVYDATDTVMSPIEDAITGVGQSISCNVVGGALSAAAGTVSAIWSGGKSTFGMQAAQWLTHQASNMCQGQQLAAAKLQLAAERRMLTEQRRMNADGATDNWNALNSMMGRQLPGMAAGGFLMNEASLGQEYGEAYPAVFAPLSPDELVTVDRNLRAQERQASILSLQSQNRVALEQAQGVARARNYAAEGRAGSGLRAELQAGNAIMGEQVAAINGLTFATMAHDRAQTETRLREEATKRAADAAATDWMKGLAECSDCTMTKTFFAN
jgi:hypothetical protein